MRAQVGLLRFLEWLLSPMSVVQPIQVLPPREELLQLKEEVHRLRGERDWKESLCLRQDEAWAESFPKTLQT